MDDLKNQALKIKQDPIREVGTYEGEANIHKGVRATFTIEVVGE